MRTVTQLPPSVLKQGKRDYCVYYYDRISDYVVSLRTLLVTCLFMFFSTLSFVLNLIHCVFHVLFVKLSLRSNKLVNL